MTSNINYSTIDTTYPKAGQDNDSQGFRDNFTAISSGLSTAKSEITALQTNVVLVADLSSGSTVVNNLQGSSITNGSYNKLYGTSYNPGAVSTPTNIDLHNGEMQIFTLSTDLTMTFTNWPVDTQYGKVRVQLKSDGNAARTVAFITSNGGTITPESGFPNPFSLNVNGKFKAVEAWTYNGGATVFMNYLGEF